MGAVRRVRGLVPHRVRVPGAWGAGAGEGLVLYPVQPAQEGGKDSVQPAQERGKDWNCNQCNQLKK